MVYHGGAREYEKNMMDFSFSANPYRPPFLKDAIKDSDFFSYPYCDSLENKIKEKLKIDGSVVLGAGITELLYMVGFVFKNKRAIIPKYTYGEYERIADLFSMKKIFVNEIDPGIEDLVREGDVLFFCNPNNPTGKYMDTEDLFDVTENKRIMVILDESFIDFSDKKPDYYNDNVIVLRSFTKPFGVPGIRVGYAFGKDEIIERMKIFRSPWSIGSLGCSFAYHALNNLDFLNESVEKIKKERERIIRKTGLKTHANFFLADVGDAKKVHEYFYKNNILVRDCTSFSLPNAIRFSIKKRKENNIFLEKLEKIQFNALKGVNYEI